MDKEVEYKIADIVREFKQLLVNKDNVFALLLKLKQSLEFNSHFSWQQVYAQLGDIYNDHSPCYNNSIFTPDVIDPDDFKKNPDNVFVFESNIRGEYLDGNAKLAIDHFGAKHDMPNGLNGCSYAILVHSEFKDDIDIGYLKGQIDELMIHATQTPEITYWYTKIGIDHIPLAKLASLFSDKIIPNNLILPKEFVDPRYHGEYLYSPRTTTFFHIKNKNNMIAVCAGDIGSIHEHKRNNVRILLPTDVIVCEREDFVLASEQTLKNLFI